jgi:hypothetical protein
MIGRRVRSSVSSGARGRHVFVLLAAEQLIKVQVSVRLELGRESREWVVENVKRGETYKTYRNILGACLP